MVWKQASDCCAGTAAIYGAPDIVKISQLFSDTDVSDTVTIHESSTWTFQSTCAGLSAFRLRNPAQDFNYLFNTSAIVASRTITFPLLIGPDTLVFECHIATLTGKTFVAPALGTPASGVMTNVTGTAACLTAGNVTTNANLTGDVTSTGNATTIANNAVDTVMIANSQVTFAKIQNVSATNRILGRDTACPGVIEEITPANVRTMINVECGSTADQAIAELTDVTVMCLANCDVIKRVACAWVNAPDAGAGCGICAVVCDTTPCLGGDLTIGANSLIFNSNDASPQAGTVASIYLEGCDLNSNVSACDTHLWRINDVIEMTLSAAALCVAGNITLSGTVDGIDIATDVAANTAKVTNATHTGDVTGCVGLTIAAKAVEIAMLDDGTDGELITWGTDAVATTVAVGCCGQVLTSGGVGNPPAFAASPAADNLGNHTATTCLLMGTNAIQFGIDVAAPAGTVSYHTVLAAGHIYNAIACDVHDFQVNNVTQMLISATQIDFQANALIDGTLDLADITVTGSLTEFNTALQCESFAILGANTFTGTQTLGCQILTFNASQTITGDAGGITHVVPACDTHEFNRCVNLTAGTVQEGGTDISPVGTHTQWIPAGAWGTVTTNGAEFAELELVTNDIMLQTFNFDTTTSEKIQFWWEPPAEWDAGTITFNVKWTQTGGGACETVIFSLAGHSYTNDDAIDAAIGGTPATVTDTKLVANNDMHISPESSAVTINGATKGEAVLLQISRTISDTLAVDAKLLGVNITYTTDEATAT